MREAIDTVPMDGEFVILEDAVSGTYAVARWSTDTAAWIGKDGVPSRITPTHWHLLAQDHHRVDLLEGSGSVYPATTAARPVTPTDTRRGRQRRKIIPITASLIAVAVAGWWLHRDEVNQVRQMTERSIAELRQALQQERDKAETLARDLAAARREIETHVAASARSNDEATRLKQAAERAAAELRQALQQERDKAETLARELATARRELEAQALTKAGDKAAENQQLTELWQVLQQERDRAEKLATAQRELETQTAALTRVGDKAAENQQLAELRHALQQAESVGAAYQESLAQERARNQGLEQQLAAYRDATPERNAAASLSSAPGTMQAPAAGKDATAQLLTSDKPEIAAAPPGDRPATAVVGNKPATMTARPMAPEAPTNQELARLTSRASLLLSQGNIGTARIVLERAAETGNATALFALAETYDPRILSAWGTLGTQGDVAKAQELYARAYAGGVREAKDRMDTLR